MANQSFVVQYLIKANDQFSSNAKKASASMSVLAKTSITARASLKKLKHVGVLTAKSLRESFTRLKHSLPGLAKNLTKLGLSKAFTTLKYGALGLAGATVMVGAKFQTGMADLSAITGATGKDFDFLKAKARELAISSVNSQTEVADAMKLIGSAKPELLKDLPALAKMTEQTLLLANAGTDVETATMAVAGGLNAFGKGAEYAAEYVNILAAGSKFGSSMISQTAEATKIAGPAARAAGLSFLQLNAAIQTTAKGNIFGSQAGTALQSIFGRLRREGYDFKKLGMPGVFEQVKRELEAIKDPTARAKAEAKKFGEEHSKVGLAILNEIETLRELEISMKDTQVAQEQANIRLNTFSKKMGLIWIKIKDKLITLFDRLEPKILEVAKSLGTWLDSLTASDIDVFGDKVIKLSDSIWSLANGLAAVVKFGSAVGTAVFNPSAGRIKKDTAKAKIVNENFQSRMKVLKYKIDNTLEAKMANNWRTSVDLNVGLAPSLMQTSKPVIKSTNRRMDVGANIGMNPG